MARKFLNGVDLLNQLITAIGAQMSTGKLLGRTTAGSGAIEEISVGNGLSLTGGTLSATGGGSGTVTSVGLSLPGIFNVTNSPVTSSGTLTGALATQSAAQVFAGPTSGFAAPSFRALALSDLPSLGTQRILGRSSAGTGGVEELQIGAGLTLSANVLNTATPGDITTSGYTVVPTCLLGRTTAGSGAIERITMGSGLTLSGGVLTATAVSGSIISSAFTMSTSRILGRSTATTGAIEEIALGSNLTLSSGTLSAVFTNRTNGTTGSGGITINADTTDTFVLTPTGSVTIQAPTGSPVNGQKLLIRIKDNGTSRSIAWAAAYRVIGATLPTSTVVNKTIYVGCIYNSSDTFWDVVATTTEA